MERVEGPTAYELLGKGPLDLRLALHIGQDVASALQAKKPNGKELARLRELLADASSLPASVVLGALGLSLLNYAVRFMKWRLYLRSLAIDVPWRESLTIFLSGFVLLLALEPVRRALRATPMELLQGRRSSSAGRPPAGVRAPYNA